MTFPCFRAVTRSGTTSSVVTLGNRLVGIADRCSTCRDGIDLRDADRTSENRCSRDMSRPAVWICRRVRTVTLVPRHSLAGGLIWLSGVSRISRTTSCFQLWFFQRFKRFWRFCYVVRASWPTLWRQLPTHQHSHPDEERDADHQRRSERGKISQHGDLPPRRHACALRR
jgi:hypothetical protein